MLSSMYFDRERALRAAEAAKRGVRLRVGLAAAAVDRRRRTASTRCRSGTARASSPDRTGRRKSRNARSCRRARRRSRRCRHSPLRTCRWKSWRLPVIMKSSSRSGAQFHRASSSFHASERRTAREQPRLRFLAAEAAAHPPAFAQHVVRRPVEHMRDHMLHFARVLRRTVDEHAVHRPSARRTQSGLPDKTVPGRRLRTCRRLPMRARQRFSRRVRRASDASAAGRTA